MRCWTGFTKRISDTLTIATGPLMESQQTVCHNRLIRGHTDCHLLVDIDASSIGPGSHPLRGFEGKFLRQAGRASAAASTSEVGDSHISRVRLALIEHSNVGPVVMPSCLASIPLSEVVGGGRFGSTYNISTTLDGGSPVDVLEVHGPLNHDVGTTLSNLYDSGNSHMRRGNRHTKIAISTNGHTRARIDGVGHNFRTTRGEDLGNSEG